MLPLGPALVGQGYRCGIAVYRNQKDRIRDGAVDQLHKASLLGGGAERCGQHSDFKIFPREVAEDRHADVGGLERGDPGKLVYAILNLAFVGGGWGALFQKKFLGDALIQTGAGGQAKCFNDGRVDHPWPASGRTTRKATTSKSSIPRNSPFMA